MRLAEPSIGTAGDLVPRFCQQRSPATPINYAAPALSHRQARYWKRGEQDEFPVRCRGILTTGGLAGLGMRGVIGT